MLFRLYVLFLFLAMVFHALNNGKKSQTMRRGRRKEKYQRHVGVEGGQYQTLQWEIQRKH